MVKDQLGLERTSPSGAANSPAGRSFYEVDFVLHNDRCDMPDDIPGISTVSIITVAIPRNSTIGIAGNRLGAGIIPPERVPIRGRVCAMGSTGVCIQTLIDTHYESLYRYAFRLSGTAGDAEDLTQETFEKALDRLRQLRDPERAKSWLFRILRNLYLHRIRNRSRHPTVSLDSVGDIPETSPDGPPEIDPAILQAALDDLDEGFRTPLILFYFEEFSYRDIAEHMDLPIGTVMSRLARAKSYLRQRLTRQRQIDRRTGEGGP